MQSAHGQRLANDKTPDDLESLRRLSAEIGADPLLTQGAGGNTSIKDGDLLWIKASGTWLAHAMDREIFVPVQMEPLLEAVRDMVPEAEQTQLFTAPHLNPHNLRPSIETTVHALMPQRVVVHVHCVDTIAWAVQKDAGKRMSGPLNRFNWAFVPYARPGLPLAIEIQRKSADGPDVLVLGNHGLVVAADTVAAAGRLLRAVKEQLVLSQRRASADPHVVDRLATANVGYRRAADFATHAVALDATALAFAAGGSLYPDHVIFLGAGVAVANVGEDAAAVSRRLGQQPPMIIFPGQGVLMRDGASAGAEAMARCLADVCTRVPEGSAVRYLTDKEHLQLTDWDAEKYRQSLNRARAS